MKSKKYDQSLSALLNLDMQSKLNSILIILLTFVSTAVYAQSPPSVEAVRLVETPLIESVPLTGSVIADQQSRLSPQVAGLVNSLLVDVGDQVTRGQVLLSLDDELVKIDRDQAKARKLQADAEWQNSNRRLQEARELKDTAIAASDVRTREAEEQISRAARDGAQAGYQRLEAEVARHTIVAPYDGIVSARNVNLGEWVSPGDDLLGLVATKPLWIHFQVPQRYFNQVTESARVQLDLSNTNGTSTYGKIYRKVPLSQSGARTFLIRVTPPEVDESLIPGLAVSGVLQLGVDRSGFMVPRDALIRYPDGRVTVWRVNRSTANSESGKAVEIKVTPGISNDGWVEVSTGLETENKLGAGDLIITRGNEALQKDMDVNVEKVIDTRPPGEVQ
ncbi:Efflux pump periplasmic linker BepF [Thalassocella blandensis]|nr:Efflux pump periplasmic linker BepF [Thalassocella blandensis]